MTNLTNLTISEALRGMDQKEFTATELTQAHLDTMEQNKGLNAYSLETPDVAMDMAKASDERRAKGEAKALDGIPVGIKDIFAVEGMRTTACSKILNGFIPPYESNVTQQMKDDGCVFLGKLSMDEFAMGSSNTTSCYGNVINPWKRTNDSTDLVPGGSSGGSAAAVSARMCMAATGTDTGGSIRQPASYCGIAGIKPTYGRCSRWGVIAFASSLDQAGIFARNAEDCALMLKSMAGHDARDSTSANIEVPDFAAMMNGDIRGMRVGIPKEYRVEGTNPEVIALWEKGIDWLKDAGAEIVDISLPHTEYALTTYYIIAPAEASSNLARYDGVRYGLRTEGSDLGETYAKSRAEGFGDEVKRRIMMGTYVLSAGYYDAYYIKAQKVRRLIAQDFMNAYEKCDVILTPTAPSAAFGVNENQDDPVAMYLNDIYTIPASLAGLPGMSVPAGLSSEGLPLGLQVLGRPWDEASVLKTAQAIEKAAMFDSTPNHVGKVAA